MKTVVLTTNPHLETGVDSTPETCEKHFKQWISSNKFMLQIKHPCHKPFELHGMTSRTGKHMRGSIEGVCGNYAVQFQSCDGSSYCTALGENDCTDTVSRQLRDSCSYQISACSEAISRRDPPPIVPCVWT